MAAYHSLKALCFYVTVIAFLVPFSSAAEFAEDAGEPNDPNQGAVTIELTKLDVNDTNLELRYKIKNSTDHDVWVCDSVNTNRTFKFEVFLAEDTKTLVIRRRLDVPTSGIWRGGPPIGRYICLRPGEDRTESLSLNLPVQSSLVYAGHGRTPVTQNARCLTLEIGFYDQDLPGLVLSILQEAYKFSGTFDADFAVKKQYFRGLLVSGSMGLLSYHEKVINDPYVEGEVLIGYSYQALAGEEVLRIKVDGLSIPYEGYVQSTSNAESNNDPNNYEGKVVTIELTKLDVNDTTLELRYKIKNGTDHDVWICDNVNTHAMPFEVFLAEDTKTLVIRKRLDVPSRAIWRTQPAGSYVLLRPGEDLPESLSLNLPVQSSFVFAGAGRTQVTRNAKCLALEIGFYDEDLPGLVYSILQEAEKFSGTFDADFAVKKEYFRGLLVRGSLGGLGGFEELNKNQLSKGQVVIYYSYQGLTGEQVLRIEVDGVSIPYEGKVQIVPPPSQDITPDIPKGTVGPR